jgi:hypothetical protein
VSATAFPLDIPTEKSFSLNPYEPVAHTSLPAANRSPRQRRVFVAFVILGLLSWGALLLVREIPIYPPSAPPQPMIFLWSALLFCMVTGFACGLVACYGIYHSIKSGTRPVLMTFVYLVTGLVLSYPSVVLTIALPLLWRLEVH